MMAHALDIFFYLAAFVICVSFFVVIEDFWKRRK
jgi:hypothetical protein